jgi:YggT family protein
MFTEIGVLLVTAVTGFFVITLLLRFLLQMMRVPFRNPLGEFIIATTNWLVLPARRVIPSFMGLDLATLLLAWLVQLLGLALYYMLLGRDLSSAPGIAFGILAGLALLDLVRDAVYILVFVVIVQAVLSWVSPYSPVAPLFDAMTRPFLRPIRKIVPLLGNVDLSPLVLIILLQVALIPLAHLRGMVAGLF